jgi:hypothetical protein
LPQEAHEQYVQFRNTPLLPGVLFAIVSLDQAVLIIVSPQFTITMAGFLGVWRKR